MANAQPIEPRITYGEAILRKFDAYLSERLEYQDCNEATQLSMTSESRAELVAEIDDSIKALKSE